MVLEPHRWLTTRLQCLVAIAQAYQTLSQVPDCNVVAYLNAIYLAN